MFSLPPLPLLFCPTFSAWRENLRKWLMRKGKFTDITSWYVHPVALFNSHALTCSKALWSNLTALTIWLALTYSITNSWLHFVSSDLQRISKILQQESQKRKWLESTDWSDCSYWSCDWLLQLQDRGNPQYSITNSWLHFVSNLTYSITNSWLHFVSNLTCSTRNSLLIHSSDSWFLTHLDCSDSLHLLNS